MSAFSTFRLAIGSSAPGRAVDSSSGDELRWGLGSTSGLGGGLAPVLVGSRCVLLAVGAVVTTSSGVGAMPICADGVPV